NPSGAPTLVLIRREIVHKHVHAVAVGWRVVVLRADEAVDDAVWAMRARDSWLRCGNHHQAHDEKGHEGSGDPSAHAVHRPSHVELEGDLGRLTYDPLRRKLAA